MAQYRLDLDLTTQELSEIGYWKNRLLRDVDPNRAKGVIYNDLGLKLPDDTLFLEPLTGTLMLTPRFIETDAFGLDDLKHAADKWEVRFAPSITNAGPGAPWVGTTHGDTLIETLVIAATVEVKLAMEALGKTNIVPVLESHVDFLANQGLWIKYCHYGDHDVWPNDVLGVMFGQFYFSLDALGRIEIYRSSDGTRQPGTWEIVHILNMTGAQRKMGVSSITNGYGPLTFSKLQIIPMGRGHLYFRVESEWGANFSAVYTVPDAEEVAGIYNITDPGTVIITGSGSFKKQLMLKLGVVSYNYVAATYVDEVFDIGYVPSTAPAVSPWWSTTGGMVGVTAEVIQERLTPWVAGATSEARVKLRLVSSPDGSHTPFVDGYAFGFPEKIDTYARNTFSITEKNIKAVSIEDGEGLDDQRLTVDIIDRLDDTIPDLRYRSEINGMLYIGEIVEHTDTGGYTTRKLEWLPWMFCLFAEPVTSYFKRRREIRLTGRNWGAAILSEKRFMFASHYGGVVHPLAVQTILRQSGFPGYEGDTDTVVLPETDLKGQGDDHGDTEFTSQPKINTPVREYLEWIVNTFSRWRLWYGPDLLWHYEPKATPTEAVVTFYRKSSDANAQVRLPVARNVKERSIPPEANLLYIYTAGEEGQPVGIGDFDKESFVPTDPNNPPANFVSRIKQAVVVDRALLQDAVLEHVFDLLFAEVKRLIVQVDWEGPFILSVTDPDTGDRRVLRAGDGAMVEGIGLVKLIGWSGGADNVRRLEHTTSMRYVGEKVNV